MIGILLLIFSILNVGLDGAVVADVNEARFEAGRSALQVNEQYERVAQLRAAHMAAEFVPFSYDDTDLPAAELNPLPSDYFEEQLGLVASEAGVASVVSGFLRFGPIRALLLSGEATHIGVATAEGRDGLIYVVIILGRPSDPQISR